MDYLAHAMDEVENILSENKRLKRQLAAIGATESEIGRAEAIVSLEQEVLLWKGRYEFALRVMTDDDKAIVQSFK